MDAWLSAASESLARKAGVTVAELALGDDETDELLRAAAFAAHESGERTNAPLLCYLLGLARGKSDVALDDLTDAVSR